MSLSLEQISKRFGTTLALDGVSLTLDPGERLGLVGENGAGKSSLMNVLYGLYQPDSGVVRFDGQPVVLKSPREAIARGIGMVHQHFTLVPTLTVAENVVLGHEPKKGLLFDVERAQVEVAATAQRLGFTLDPKARVSQLTVGSQQKVEIVKALHRGAKTLILDEPTAVLTPQEADELFAITRKLSAEGTTVVLISHKLKDVLAFSTRIAVMRLGKMVDAQVDPKTATPEQLAEKMIGTREGGPPPPTRGRVPEGREGRHATDPRVELKNLSCAGVKDLTLTLHAGEILGVAGVDGNGQRELAEVLTGLRARTRGELLIDGKPQHHWNPRLARAAGIAHIPEDRLHRAIVPDATVEENVSLGRQHLPPFARGALIDFKGRRERTAKLLEAHDVRPREPERRIGDLSGGNQQKLVVGRELDAQPKVLVVVQPTRGLDIAAVEAVRGHLQAVASSGAAVLLVSLDLDEVLQLSDRVVVMFEGRINAELQRPANGAWDERAIGRQMLGAKESA
ncbi:MAG: ABC transporter ATP-binding protein [Myxococcaceae bacterium]